jgi:uncharacterized protein (TIGR03790 family)
MQKLIQAAIFIVVLGPLGIRAGGDEVIVIYNKRLPESKAVADYYAKMRNVPAKQVYGFNLTTNEEMSRPEFQDALQAPLLKKLEADGIWKVSRITVPATNGQPERIFRRVAESKIRYAVLCYGVPLKIANDPGIHDDLPANVPELFRRNEAAVDSELVWLPLLEANASLAGPRQNWIYGVTNVALLHPTNGILLVSRLDGPNANIARGLVDKSLQAERDGLWGRAYFDARGLSQAESNYVAGDQIILGAAQLARVIGYETVVDTKPATFSVDFPMSQVAFYMGWYDEHVSGPFSRTNIEFMPGAFAYHLHSFSAATIRSATNRWAGPLLARGATCTLGCIDEPSLQFTPNVALFLERFSINQFTFGEAAWVSQMALSWQITVIGDPLYRPFGKLPEQLHADLAQRHSPLVEWSFLRLVNANAMRGATGSQLIDALESLPARTNSAVLTEKLADLCRNEGKTASAIDDYQESLQLHPSPLQKIRIRLALADLLAARDRKKDTYDDLRKILEENPDYPAKFTIMKRVLDLAIALGDKNEITRSVEDMQKYAPKAE